MYARLGVPLALGFGAILAVACRAGEGERCICGDDCKDGLSCVVDGRVLESDECLAAGDPDADPGECIDDQSGAGEEEGGFAPPLYMDLGGKRDFEPGPPPTPTSGPGSEGSSGDDTTGSPPAGTDSGTTDAGDSGTTASTAGSGTGASTTGSSSTTGSVTTTGAAGATAG